MRTPVRHPDLLPASYHPSERQIPPDPAHTRHAWSFPPSQEPELLPQNHVRLILQYPPELVKHFVHPCGSDHPEMSPRRFRNMALGSSRRLPSGCSFNCAIRSFAVISPATVIRSPKKSLRIAYTCTFFPGTGGTRALHTP